MVRSVLLALVATTVAAQETELVISAGTHDGLFFKSNPSDPSQSGDIGPMK